MVSHAQRIGHDGQCRIDGPAGREETRINNIQIVYVMCLAANVEGRRLWVVAEANRPVLVRHPCQWNALAEIQVAREQSLIALVAIRVRTPEASLERIRLEIAGLGSPSRRSNATILRSAMKRH